MTGGEATTILLRRVRDPSGTGISRAVVLRFLTEAERMLVAARRLVIATLDFELPTNRTTFRLSDVVPGAQRIDSITYAGRTLEPMSLAGIVSYDRAWFRSIGRPEAWCPIGRSLFAIYPGVASAAHVVTIDYIPILTTLAETTPLRVRDEEATALLELAEIFIYTRNRLLTDIPPALEQFSMLFQKLENRGVAS